jgi:hypothetical protein
VQFIKLNAVKEDKTGPLLLTHLSDETYRLARNLVHPMKLEEVKFDELVILLNQHFTPKRCTFADRARFYAAMREIDETVEQWGARVRGLAVHCEFGSALDMMLRDRLVLGLRAGPERDRLFEQDAATLTFAKAVEVAQQAECARKVRALALPSVTVKEEPLYRASAGRAGQGASRDQPARRCSVCGMKGHGADKCRYKNYRCLKCQNKGHLKKVCDVRVNNISSSEHSEDLNPGIQDCGDCRECKLFNLRCVNYDPIVMTVGINGNNYDMEVDSGSSTSVVSDIMYETNFSKIPLRSVSLKMCFYNGHKITPLGCFSAEVSYRDMTKQILFYVIKNGGPGLLGRDFMAKFGISLMCTNTNYSINCSSDMDVNSLLNKYKELFNDDLGCFKYGEVKLQLKEGVIPRFCKARPLPFALKGSVEDELMRLVDKGILIPITHSEYATPIVPVRKANGSVRICADYSLTINNDAYIEKYPLPRIEEVFAKLSGGQHFSKLDCSQAYNQFPLSKESQRLTTINTTKGLFMYSRLVFGYSGAPAIFQRALESVLAGIEGVAVFLDDVCVTGPTKEIHVSRLEEVFRRFQNAGLKLGKEKCAFFQGSVTYLGHIINKNGLHKCPEKVDAIVNAPQPNNVTELKRFLGMSNYYRNFVPNASSLLGPLHELLRADTPWQWTDRQQAAFTAMKQELASDRVLAHFEPDAQLSLAVDAGPYGLGAVLAQIGSDGVERPLAYGSRSLSAGERNYSQLHKEAAAIVFGVKRFHQYLYGRQDPFVLKTDHKPLLAIFGKSNGIPVMTASRLIRFGIFLSAYNYKIKYISSKQNEVADYFSRIPSPGARGIADDGEEMLTINSLQLNSLPLTYKDIQAATARDKDLCTVLKYIKYGWPRKIRCKNIMPYFLCRNELDVEQGCLLRGHRVVIPATYRCRVLHELHKSHQGIVKTKSNARARLWWPNVDKDIEQLITACTVCVHKRSAPPRAAPAPWPQPASAWERVHIDYFSVGQRSFLVVVDAYSKWLECLDMGNDLTTRHLITKMKFLIARFGLPSIIVSDNDAKIASREFVEFCEINGIQYLTSPIYHPCSNGLAEINVRTCKTQLKSILQYNSCVKTINDKLQDFLFEYRNTKHCTTGASPARLMIGRELRCRLDLLRLPPTRANNGCENEHSRVFQIGDIVWARCYGNRKPFWAKATICKKLGNRMYEIKLENNDNIVCKRHVDQLFKYTEATTGLSSTNDEPMTHSVDYTPYTCELDSPAIAVSDNTDDPQSHSTGEEARMTEEVMTETPIQADTRVSGAPSEQSELPPGPSPAPQPSCNLRPRTKKINYKLR